MKKKLSYRDKLLELAYIYNVREIQDYAKNRKNLTEYTRILDRLLRSGKWFIPLFHDPLHRVAHQENISIPEEMPLYGFNPWTAWEK